MPLTPAAAHLHSQARRHHVLYPMLSMIIRRAEHGTPEQAGRIITIKGCSNGGGGGTHDLATSRCSIARTSVRRMPAEKSFVSIVALGSACRSSQSNHGEAHSEEDAHTRQCTS
jgi:hypothetical protein